MLNRIFPRQFDNAYRGHWLGLWLFVPVVLLKATQGAAVVFDTRNSLISADGIPLESYGAAAGETVVALSALVGFFLLSIAVLGAVALIRYRAMIPFMFLVQLIVQLGGWVLREVNPIARAAETSLGFAGHPVGFWVNIGILAATAIGFALSLRNRTDSPKRDIPE